MLKDTTLLILAAGKGTRMKSDLPKVMHELLGKPMLWYILRASQKAGFKNRLVVAGHGHELIIKELKLGTGQHVLQKEQLGTGHALQVAWPVLEQQDCEWCLVVNGDAPLLTESHLDLLCAQVKQAEADMGIISLKLEDPKSYGRIVKNNAGMIQQIVEAKDFQADRHGEFSGEVNSGIYLFRMKSIRDILFKLDQDNNQNELYITQLIELGITKGLKITSFCAGDCPELLGVNSPAELVMQEEYLREKIVLEAVSKGVIIRNMTQVRIGPDAVVEPGAEITGPCEIYGRSMIGAGSRISSHCHINDSTLKNCEVLSFSHLHGAEIEPGAVVGPFARLRPGTVLGSEAKAGNFVEIKNSSVGAGSKVSHLSYIGDSILGDHVNIGAGTITCNYDGQKKHKTIIESNVFVGSNTALVAPVVIKQDSMVGAGSTITIDVPSGALAIGRSRQKNLSGKNPLKKT